MKPTSIKIQQEFYQEIAQNVTLLSLHFILPLAGLLPIRPAQAWHNDQYHCRDNHGNLAICRAVPVPVQSPVRGRLGCCRVTQGQPAVQRPTLPAAAAQASSWVSSSQSLDCCSPAAHLSSQTLLYRPASLGNRRSKCSSPAGLHFYMLNLCIFICF